MVSRAQQRGAAGVLLIILLAAVMFGVLVTALSGASTQGQYDAKTAPVLAVAQRALIAYAAAHPTLPGRLPCPDTTNTGVADSSCGPVGASRLGRLPWKTLGIPDLRDGSGECLWYAVSGAFKEISPTTPVNSDTSGQFTIKDDTGNNLATGVIAVILAPGPPLAGGGVRATVGTPQCGGNTIASAYLDAVGAVDNAAATPSTFVAGTPTDTFNDRLIYITPAQLFPAVERRVAAEAKKALLSYYSANFYYPFANDYNDASYDCTPGFRRGRFPVSVASSCPGLVAWPTAVPGWFTTDNWNRLTYYTLAPACAFPNTLCTPGTLLTVNNTPVPNNNKNALVIVAGPPLAGQTRPSVNVADYLDGSVNTDGDDVYITQPVSPTFNDIVVIVAP